MKLETLHLKLLLLAIALFVPLFLTGGVGPFDFWWWMTANLLILLGIVQWVDASWRRELMADLKDRPTIRGIGILPMIHGLEGRATRKVLLGLLSAGVLYLIFWLGDKAVRYLLAGAAHDIAAVYAFKDQAPTLRIVLLMLLVIGPGEELFWRGFLQRHLERSRGRWSGWLLATAIYTAVHVAAGNPILVLAAGVCGAFWGWLYLRYRSLLLNAVSHTVWDLVIFILLPLG